MRTREQARASAAERASKRATERQIKLEALSSEPLNFVDRDTLAAVPAIGGVLSDLGLDHLHRDFSDTCIVRVSERLARLEMESKDNARFIIVKIGKKRAALTLDEAEAHGLPEDKSWRWVPAGA